MFLGLDLIFVISYPFKRAEKRTWWYLIASGITSVFTTSLTTFGNGTTDIAGKTMLMAMIGL
jgi:hypothetical protein